MDFRMSRIVSNNKKATNPFLRWPGGKRWLSEKISCIINSHGYKRYYEPFLGGGAVFFRLAPLNAHLSDINFDLITTYKSIRDHQNEVLERLKNLPVGKKAYYEIRASDPSDKIDLAARFLYLNRLSFNGIYRVNKIGKFNVPYGGDRTVDLLWENNLLSEASNTLLDTVITCVDFEEAIAECGEGDIVYCDPAYSTKISNDQFLRYNDKVFSWEDQKRLARCCFEAVERGVFVVVSNASHQSIAKLYHPIEPIILNRYSGVSCSPEGRKTMEEALYLMDQQLLENKIAFSECGSVMYNQSTNIVF